MDFDVNQWFSVFPALLAGRLLLAWLPGLIASKRGRSFWVGFILALVVDWLPALLIMAVLPARGRREGGGPGDRAALEKEQRRLEEAERRAGQAPAAPVASSAPKERVRSRGAEAGKQAASAATTPPLPMPTVQPLPADLHADPMADAPRADLRGGSGSTSLTPDDRTAGPAASPSEAADRPEERAGQAQEAPEDSQAPSESQPAPAAPSRKPPRASLSADGSST